ncbi:MAG: hypothetical protein RLZ25_1363 [Pseudomonadota bacterium]
MNALSIDEAETVTTASGMLSGRVNMFWTIVNGSVRLLARGGDVRRPPRFTAVSKNGAKCFIHGAGYSRRMKLRGSVGGSCSVTASNSGNKIFDSVTSNTVTVNIR